jgi:NADPH:quinone reductase-like Zn-dependent oxidoreductase
MKAIVQSNYGPPVDVLELGDVGEPVVKDDEVLVRVHAASVHPDVWHIVRGLPYVLRVMGAGLRRPKNPIPGTDVAGRVESVGRDVTHFRAGDEVFGETIKGYQWTNGGAYAERVSVPESQLAPKPANIAFEQAAAVPTSGLIVLHNFPNGGWLRAGKSVLINGAGGGVGALAVQIAKSYGARVTGVDSSDKLGMIRSLGADLVIDYTKVDFTRSDERYDLIFDIPGNRPFAECRRVLAPDGKYVLIGHDGFGKGAGRWLGSVPRVLKLVVLSPFVSQLPPPTFSMPDKKASMELLRELLEAGKLTPVIDRTYSLGEVPEAIRYLEEGHARGKVVVSVLNAESSTGLPRA